MSATRHLLDTSQDELRQWLTERGHPSYRADQVANWVFARRAISFDEMSNLSKALRAELAESFLLTTTKTVKQLKAADGTEKLLVELADGKRIECVLIREGARRTVCISTQVGCAMGCVFCASGLDGVARNLTTGEIVEQMLLLARLLPEDERLSHIVVMGMGEPLANVERLMPALEMASSDQGLGISVRRITISTVGLPSAIDRLISKQSKYHLAVSLHAPNDQLRNRLVPVNSKIGLDAILTAADEYFEASGRRLTYEYVLLANENDQPAHAKQLAHLLRGRAALLNVIPYNPVAGLPYETPSEFAVNRFRNILTDAGINLQLRQRKGDKINAACGQLRRSGV